MSNHILRRVLAERAVCPHCDMRIKVTHGKFTRHAADPTTRATEKRELCHGTGKRP